MRTLDTLPHHEACTTFDQRAAVSSVYALKSSDGQLVVELTDSVFMFPNKYEAFKSNLDGVDSVYNLSKFRSSKWPLDPSLVLSGQGETLAEPIRLSGWVIDVLVDPETGIEYLIATTRDGGSQMGSSNKITLSAGGFYGSDLREWCVRELAEESPYILRWPDGKLFLWLPHIIWAEVVARKGLTDGIHEFLQDKHDKFKAGIENDPEAQERFLAQFGVPHDELWAFLEGFDIDRDLVWMSAEEISELCNTEVIIQDGSGKTIDTQKLWVNDERDTTRSYELRIPVRVTLPSWYTLAGVAPKLYLESTVQKPVVILDKGVYGWVRFGDAVELNNTTSSLLPQLHMLEIMRSQGLRVGNILEKK